MNSPVQNVVGLFAGIWPRIAGFSTTPSLLVVALIANLVAGIPSALRLQKEMLARDPAALASAESAPETSVLP